MSTNNSGGGIGFAGLLTIVFIVLKLTNVISWSWLWVLSPLWISFGLALVGFAIFGITVLFIKASDKRAHKKAIAARAARGKTIGIMNGKKW